jgi:Flp pilus assembly protein TadD
MSRFCLSSVLLSLVLGSQLPAAEKTRTVRGRVMLDANRNGKIDADEKGLPGVAVSDGVNFVRTEADGSFTIEVADDPVIPFKPAQVIAVSWPSGYWPASLWYRRMADLGEGDELLFALRKDEQKLPFTMVHSSDPHNNFGGELSRAWREEVRGLGDAARFCIITGDLGYAGEKNADAMFGSLQQYARAFPIPLFYTIGNHDVVGIHKTDWKKQTELHGNGAYTKYLGPIRWSFDYAGVHFVGLDWAREVAGTIQIGVAPSAVEWLAKDFARLKPGTRIFLFMHSQWSPDGAFWQLLQKYKLELLLAGHSHQHLDVSWADLKMLTTINLRRGAPYRMLHVHKNGHQTVDRCSRLRGDSHTRHCSLSVPGALAGLRREHVEPKVDVLDSATTKIGKGNSRWVEISLEIKPEGAKRCGLRIVPADGDPIELSCQDNTLVSGPLVIPTVRGAADEPFKLHVHVVNGRIKVRANGRVFFEKPLATDKPVRVELFAEGGRARFSKVNLWTLAHDDVKSLLGLIHHHGYQRQKGRATDYYRAILRVAPNRPAENLAFARLAIARGKSSEAETSLRRITGADQKNVAASELLATLYVQTARDPEAVKLYRQILKWEPKRINTMNQLAWLLAVSVNKQVRDGAEALRLATAACEATERKEPGYLDTLAAAQARVGRFEEAIATIDSAIRLSVAGNKWSIVNPMKERRAMYLAKKAFPSR